MTLKIHHLVAATDGKTCTQLTNIYAETYEQAMQEARLWHMKHFPYLPTLTVKAQPQGFQAGFLRLPGAIEETMKQRWCIKELLAEKGMSMKRLACLSGVSYRTVCRLCYNPFHAGEAVTIEKLAHVLAVPSAQLQTTVTLAVEKRLSNKEKVRNT